MTNTKNMSLSKRDMVTIKIINKMLEKYNVDYDYVCKNPNVENKAWYDFFTMTTIEYEELRKWAIVLIRKTLKERKIYAEHSFDMLNLYCGLKIKDDDHTTG